MPGGIGIGLVWGWLIGGRRWSPPSASVWSLVSATLAAEAALLAGPGVAVALLGAAVVAAALHAAWSYQLRQQRGASGSS